MFSRVLVPLYDTLGPDVATFIINLGEGGVVSALTHTHTHTQCTYIVILSHIYIFFFFLLDSGDKCCCV